MVRLLTVVLITLLWGCTPAPPPTALDDIQERGTLRVGTLLNPTSYYLNHDREAGFEYELAREFADELEVELEMVPRYSVRDLFELLQAGKVDVVAAGIDRTEKRDALYRFGPAYQTITQKLVYKQGTRQRPRDFDELEDEIVVVSGSSHHEFLLSLGDRYPQLNWRATDDHDAEELLELIMRDEINFTIADSNTLDVKRRYYPDLSVAFTVRDETPVAWALAAGFG